MDNIATDPKIGGYVAVGLGLAFLSSVIASEHMENVILLPSGNVRVENFGNEGEVQNNSVYRGPNASQRGQDISLNKSGDQLLSYQLYQQAVNAATPTKQQLDAIAGQSSDQSTTNPTEKTAAYNIMNGNFNDATYQAVNMGNNRAQSISACAQNAPTFVATSLLPKPDIPGQKSWDINAPSNILANQNFLSATQQMGVDTVLSSLRNSSYDIRGNISNPISIVSPWLNTTITPDLERKPLECNLPTGGLYGCGK